MSFNFVAAITICSDFGAPENKKLLEENTYRIFSNINHSKILYDPPPRVMEIKTNKWDLIKLKSSCTLKETVSKVKLHMVIAATKLKDAYSLKGKL